MVEIITDPEALAEHRLTRFRILVCVDGSEESYKAVNYAAEVGKGKDADIVLLYVRPLDQGLRTGGLQVRVARENMLNWGLELPGIQYLKKARDVLISNEELAVNWDQHSAHTDIAGDPLGDNKIAYINADNKAIVLKLKTASSIAAGILDQYDLGPYQMIILGNSGAAGGISKSLWDPAIAEKVAIHAPCSVCVTRNLEMGKGMLLCVDGSDRSIEMLGKAVDVAKRVGADISIMSVALDGDSEKEANKNVSQGIEKLNGLGVSVKNKLVVVGNPVEEIINNGIDYSFIVLADTGKTGLKRFFMGSVAFKVMEYANNSVMILR